MAEVPVIQLMLQKLLNKGHRVEVVETHRVWRGPVVAVDTSKSTPGAVEVRVLNEDQRHHTFTMMQPERWKLGKNAGGDWNLWPPRARSRT